MYRLVFTETARADLLRLQRKSPDSIKKLTRLLEELIAHPRTGTGQVERLRHCSEETWSRRISHEHRLVYRILEKEIEVLVISSFGHYQ